MGIKMGKILLVFIFLVLKREVPRYGGESDRQCKHVYTHKEYREEKPRKGGRWIYKEYKLKKI